MLHRRHSKRHQDAEKSDTQNWEKFCSQFIKKGDGFTACRRLLPYTSCQSIKTNNPKQFRDVYVIRFRRKQLCLFDLCIIHLVTGHKWPSSTCPAPQKIVQVESVCTQRKELEHAEDRNHRPTASRWNLPFFLISSKYADGSLDTSLARRMDSVEITSVLHTLMVLASHMALLGNTPGHLQPFSSLACTIGVLA